MVFRTYWWQIMTLCYWGEIQKSWKILKSMILLRIQWNLAWMSFFAMRDYLDDFQNNMMTNNDTLLWRWNPKIMNNSKIHDFPPNSMKFGVDEFFSLNHKFEIFSWSLDFTSIIKCYHMSLHCSKNHLDSHAWQKNSSSPNFIEFIAKSWIFENFMIFGFHLKNKGSLFVSTLF